MSAYYFNGRTFDGLPELIEALCETYGAEAIYEMVKRCHLQQKQGVSKPKAIGENYGK